MAPLPGLGGRVQLRPSREEPPAQPHFPPGSARSDSSAGSSAGHRPQLAPRLERTSDKMCGAKSKSLAFAGLLLSCLEMVSATYLL